MMIQLVTTTIKTLKKSNQIEPDVTQLGSRWKAVINEKKQQVLMERNRKNIKLNNTSQYNNFKSSNDNTHKNIVKIVDQTYLTKSYVASTELAQKHIETIIKDFSLNVEPERAFRIIANYASDLQSEQLLMYIAGMAGTGKSQVIKLLYSYSSSVMNTIDL